MLPTWIWMVKVQAQWIDVLECHSNHMFYGPKKQIPFSPKQKLHLRRSPETSQFLDLPIRTQGFNQRSVVISFEPKKKKTNCGVIR